MNLRTALHASSLTEILDAFPDIQESQPMSKKKQHSPGLRKASSSDAHTKHARMRASQGAIQSGHPNVPDGVGHVPNEEETDPMERAKDIEDGNDFEANEESMRAELAYVGTQKDVDTPAASKVESPIAAITPPSPAGSPALHGATKMTLTLKSLSKNGKRAIYTGAAQTIAISLGAFPDKTAPASIEVADVFAPAKAPRVPREKMTEAEKLAAREARKNAPKKTLAEKVRLADERAAKLRAKLAAEASM